MRLRIDRTMVSPILWRQALPWRPTREASKCICVLMIAGQHSIHPFGMSIASDLATADQLRLVSDASTTDI
jgi:hypothetical protein